MALAQTGIPDNRAELGPSNNLRTYQYAAGVSDYVTGGYPINASAVDLSQIFNAWKVGQNAASSAYIEQIVFPASSYTNAGPATQVLLKILNATTGLEVANGFNLTGCIWNLAFIGY
jgi:hypothetical protein